MPTNLNKFKNQVCSIDNGQRDWGLTIKIKKAWIFYNSGQLGHLQRYLVRKMIIWQQCLFNNEIILMKYIRYEILDMH